MFSSTALASTPFQSQFTNPNQQLCYTFPRLEEVKPIQQQEVKPVQLKHVVVHVNPPLTDKNGDVNLNVELTRHLDLLALKKTTDLKASTLASED